MTQIPQAPLSQQGQDYGRSERSDDWAGLGNMASAFDLHEIISTFRRRLKLFLAIALAVFIVVLIITIRATPEYTATSSVMIDNRRETVVSGNPEVLGGLSTDAPTVESEVEILHSRQLASRVVAELHLEDDPEFNPALRKPGMIDRIKTSIGNLFNASAPDRAKNELTEIAQQRREERVVDRVRSNLDIRRIGVTYVMNIAFTSQDEAKAAKISNAFAERYLLEQLEAKFDATRQANTWLNGRLADLRTEVQQNEAAAEQYRAANNLLSASGQTLTEQEISTYNQQLATVRAQQAEDEARLRTARSQLAAGSTGEDVGEALDSTVIQQLRSRRAEISGRIADMSSRYGPRHPDMLRAQGELADVDTQIRAEIGRIISNLEAKAQVSRERTASMSGSLAGARGTLTANNAAGVRLNELLRNAESSKTLYEGLLDRYKQTTAQAGLEQSDARIVSKASIPTRPSSPNIPLNLAIGLLLALGSAVAVVVLVEMLDTGLATATDIERRLHLPSLGSVPLVSSVAERGDRTTSPTEYLIQRPLSAFAEAVRGLRTAITFSRLGQDVKVVVVTSSLPGEGKTTTAVCLARSAAQSGQSVLIIDCDLRRRSINAVLGLEPKQGLLEVLNGQTPLNEAVIRDEASGAYILPMLNAEFTPKDVFRSSEMDRLLQQVRQQFDFVILDTAPVLAVAETRTLASKVDAVVFLTRWRKTPVKAVENSLKLLDQAGAHVAGVTLVQVDMKSQATYGYGDAGYYYDAYKRYYAS